jgi:hypothetical protein
MIDNPIIINDYSDPIECVKKEEKGKCTLYSPYYSNNIVKTNVDSNNSIATNSITKSPRSFYSRNHLINQIDNHHKNFLEKTNQENNLKNNLKKNPEEAIRQNSGFKIPRLNIPSPRFEDVMTEELPRKTENSQEIKKSRNRSIIENLRNIHSKTVLRQNKTHFRAASDFAIFDSNNLLN